MRLPRHPRDRWFAAGGGSVAEPPHLVTFGFFLERVDPICDPLPTGSGIVGLLFSLIIFVAHVARLSGCLCRQGQTVRRRPLLVVLRLR